MEAFRALSRLMMPLGLILACAPASVVADADGQRPPPSGPTPPPPAARHSAKGLRSLIAAAQARMSSIRVETENSDYPDGESRRAGIYLHRVVAAKAPSSFMHHSAHGRRNMDWRVDPEGQHAIIANGKALNINGLNRAYIEDPWPDERALPGTLPTELFFYATGLYPLTGRTPPRDPSDGTSPLVLADVAASRLYDRVRPVQERVDDRWCHVMEHPGRDALWIDVEHGCAVLMRESYHRPTGFLVWRTECSGHKEMAPGVWIPDRIRNIHFDYQAPTAEARRRRILDTITAIVRAEVNSVSDDEFRYNPPPGALWLNGPSDTPVQTVPSGEDLLDELVDWSRGALAERWSQTPLVAGAWHRGTLPFALFGAAVAGLGSWAVLVRGRRLARSRDGDPPANPGRPR